MHKVNEISTVPLASYLIKNCHLFLFDFIKEEHPNNLSI